MFRVLRRRLAKTAQPRAPLVCSRCGADALCPIEWVTFGDHAWLMWMRCGECGRPHEAIVDNPTAAEIDVEMDRQRAWRSTDPAGQRRDPGQSGPAAHCGHQRLGLALDDERAGVRGCPVRRV